MISTMSFHWRLETPPPSFHQSSLARIISSGEAEEKRAAPQLQYVLPCPSHLLLGKWAGLLDKHVDFHPGVMMQEAKRRTVLNGAADRVCVDVIVLLQHRHHGGDIAMDGSLAVRSQVSDSTASSSLLSMRASVRRCSSRVLQAHRCRRYGSRMPASMMACSTTSETFRVCATRRRYCRSKVGACTFKTPRMSFH